MSIGSLIGGVVGGVIGFVCGGPAGMFYGASIGFALGMALDPMTPDAPSAGDPAPEGFEAMSSTVGDPVPDIAGTAKIAGHLLWYGAERNVAVYNDVTGGKGGDTDEQYLTGYEYYMSWVLGIAAGPIDTLYSVFINDDEAVWTGELNCPASGGQETIVLDGLGSMTFYFGTADQVANTQLGTLLDDATLNTPYRNFCWAFLDDCYIGEYPRTPTLTFVLKKIPTNVNFSYPEIQTYDCNAAHLIWYILHDLTGLPESWLHIADFTTLATTLSSEGRGLSLLFDKQQDALSYLENINAHIGGIIRYGSDAKFHPKLIRDDYVVDDLLLINESVTLEEPEFSRKSWIDTVNEIKVQFSGLHTAGDIVWTSVGSITNAYRINDFVTYNDSLLAIIYTAHDDAIVQYDGEISWDAFSPQPPDPGINNEKYTAGIYADTGKLYIANQFNGVFSFDGSSWVDCGLNGLRTKQLIEHDSGGEAGNNLWAISDSGGGDASYYLYRYKYPLTGWAWYGTWEDGNSLNKIVSFNYELYCAICVPGVETHLEIHRKLDTPGDYECVGVFETSSRIGAFCVCQNFLYVGIHYEYSTPEVWRYDGDSSWTKVGEWLDSDVKYITSLCCYNNRLYAGVVRDCETPEGYVVYADLGGPYFTGVGLLGNTWHVSNLHIFNGILYAGTSNSQIYKYTGGCSLRDTLDFEDAVSNPVAFDVGNYVTQERIVSKTLKFALFTTNANATWAAQNQLRLESYPFATLKLVVNRDMFRLQVGDCFKFSYAKYGISNMICRILQISEDNLQSEKITIQAMEDIFAISNITTIFTDPTPYTPDPPTYELLPFIYQRVSEAPYTFSSDVKVIPFACRRTAQDLGFDIYMSIDGGSSYLHLGKSGNLLPYGTLVNAYSADTYTIDDDVGITIDFVADASVIDTVMWSDIFSGQKNTALLGDELISFQSITPVFGTQYKLEGVIRGRYGTKKISHAEDEGFYHIHTKIDMFNSSEIVVGASRKFKLVPYNLKYKGDLSEATAIDLTIEGETRKPYIPINFMANGSSFVARYSADIVLTWSPRYRGRGAGIGIPGTVLPDTDRDGYFTIEIWVSSVKVRTQSVIDAATWTYTEVMNNADNGSLADEVLFKLLNYRVEESFTYSSDQVEVTCKKT